MSILNKDKSFLEPLCPVCKNYLAEKTGVPRLECIKCHIEWRLVRFDL